MTTTYRTMDAPKRGRGRPPADPSGTGRRVTVSLPPATLDALAAEYGTAYTALATLADREAKRLRRRNPEPRAAPGV